MSGHITGDKIVVVETRRRWSDEERRQAVEETQSLPVSVVARKHGIAKSLLFRWRKEAGLAGKRRKAEVFIPVRLALPSVAPPAAPAIPQARSDEGLIEIELSGGVKLRVSGSVKPDTLRQVIAALRD